MHENKRQWKEWPASRLQQARTLCPCYYCFMKMPPASWQGLEGRGFLRKQGQVMCTVRLESGFPVSPFSSEATAWGWGTLCPLVGLGQSFLLSWLLSQEFFPPTHKQHSSSLRGLERLTGEKSWAVPQTELLPKEWSEGQRRGGKRPSANYSHSRGLCHKEVTPGLGRRDRECSHSSPCFPLSYSCPSTTHALRIAHLSFQNWGRSSGKISVFINSLLLGHLGLWYWACKRSASTFPPDNLLSLMQI